MFKVLQLDYSSGACPQGYFLLHLSQSCLREAQEPFMDLDRVLSELLKCGASCIFRCRYLHRPRETRRWDSGTPCGHFLERCQRAGSLAVVSDPPAVPQMLAKGEVQEASALVKSFGGPSSYYSHESESYMPSTYT